MASDVVQFREDGKVLEDLRKSGINPNEFGRVAFEDAYRRFAVGRRMKFIEEMREKLRKRMTETGAPAPDWTAIIRKDRDSR